MTQEVHAHAAKQLLLLRLSSMAALVQCAQNALLTASHLVTPLRVSWRLQRRQLRQQMWQLGQRLPMRMMT